MEEAEPPECPVCLIPYDAVSAIPRVLPCGHTTCEACLKQLPNPFPNTVRCTVCIVLVKFPNSPSNLPKNLDLLHFSSLFVQNHQPIKEKSDVSPLEASEKKGLNPFLIAKSWSDEFYRKWRIWILCKDCIGIEETGFGGDDGVVCGKVLKTFDSGDDSGDAAVSSLSGFSENEIVGLVKVGIFAEDDEDSKFFDFGYEWRIMSVLYGINEKKRDELDFILNATLVASNVGKVFGFWYYETDRSVYMVCKKFFTLEVIKCLLKKKRDEVELLSADEMRGLGMLGMEISEVLSRLHSQGLVIGCFSVNCFSVDKFGHACIDLSEVLDMGRRVNMAAHKGWKELEVSLKDNASDDRFSLISPEMLLQFLVKERSKLDREHSRCEVGSASDVWSLACLLVWLIVGSLFVQEMESLLHDFVNVKIDEKESHHSDLYMSWMEKVASLLRRRLGGEYVYLQVILCRCLDFDPGNRPLLTEVWKCLRELVIKPQFDIGLGSNQQVKKPNSAHCIVLGELCRIIVETSKEFIDGLPETDAIDKLCNGDVVEGVSKGRVKCAELKGHLDCITGLAIGGGFLFSSSYDKIVHVWSLQDFSLVHSFKGHEHRITALVFGDGDEPLCFSSDNEGVICIWKASVPFSEVPIKKLYEQKDWRYSGIHAMAISGTEYLYTGSGDKLIKAWSLQDYTLSCTMSGHNSVVSSLVVCNGVLYSGSWDGTVRLWSPSDHSPLAVLGEDKVGDFSSVLSLSAEQDLLVVGHESGSVKIWHNDILLKSNKTHKGAVFSVNKNGKWLFSGGWDKTINVQAISEDVDGMDVIPVGTIASNSTITALICWQGKLFVGQADKIIKVYHGVQ